MAARRAGGGRGWGGGVDPTRLGAGPGLPDLGVDAAEKSSGAADMWSCYLRFNYLAPFPHGALFLLRSKKRACSHPPSASGLR